MTPPANHDVLPGWALLAIYAAGFVITARVYFATDDEEEDRAEARFHAGLVGLLWPFALTFLAVCALFALPTLGAKTRQDRREQAAAAALERLKLDARIAELEAENDRLRRIGGQP